MKKFASALLLLCLTGTISASAATFTDSTSTYQYNEAVDYLSSQKIVSGYPDGTFKPHNTINRAELLKILIEAEFSEQSFDPFANQKCFPDIDASAWYTKYVCFAKNKGIVQGDGNTGFFRPSDAINVVEALKITLKTFGYEYEDTGSNDTSWYWGIVNKASELNYIPQTYISTSQFVTRGEVADSITRVLKDKEGNLKKYLGAKEKYRVTLNSLRNNINVETAYHEGANTSESMVTIYTEELYETENASHRSFPTERVWMQEGYNDPEILVDAIGGVGQYPIGYILSPDKKTLYVNLESKLVAIDIASKTQKDFFIPKQQVYSLVFSEDGKSMLIWDQIYASQNGAYDVEKVNIATGKIETLASGVNKDAAIFGIIAWWEESGTLILQQPLGEAAAFSYMDLTSGKISSVPGIEAGIFIGTFANGRYAYQSIKTARDACHGIFESTPSKYKVVQSVNPIEFKIGEFGDGVRAVRIEATAPGWTGELIYSQYTPKEYSSQDLCPSEPDDKQYFMITVNNISDADAELVYTPMTEEQAKLQIKEWYPDRVETVYHWGEIYLNGIKSKIESSIFNLQYAYLK